MKEKYLVPEYYKTFSCKGGACRKTCCKGWEIALSEDEYFRLLGINCSASLRAELDRALYPEPHATVEKYASIVPNFFGDCPMHGKDGYCDLQKECGEKVLPAICRLYPRSFHSPYDNSACISCSCEKVLEIIYSDKEKLTFTQIDNPFPFTVARDAENAEKKAYVRSQCLRLLEDRDYTLSERLKNVEDALNEIKSSGLNNAEKTFSAARSKPPKRSSLPSYYAIYVQNLIVKYLATNSISLGDYVHVANAYYGFDFEKKIIRESHPAIREKFALAEKSFYQLFPDYDVFLEKVLVNHAFYCCFPFETEDVFRDFISLAGVYSFVKFMTVSVMRDNGNKDELIDLTGELFRFIEHSNFTKNVNVLLFDDLVGSEKRIDEIIKL